MSRYRWSVKRVRRIATGSQSGGRKGDGDEHSLEVATAARRAIAARSVAKGVDESV
jgi:hypothetical protein